MRGFGRIEDLHASAIFYKLGAYTVTYPYEVASVLEFVGLLISVGSANACSNSAYLIPLYAIVLP